MHAKRVLRVLFLGALLMGLTPAGIALADGPPAFGGHVVDADSGEPLPYVTVRLFEGETFIAETTTDQWGEYEFDMYQTDYRSYWYGLWDKTCFARISRTGWTSQTTNAGKFDTETYPFEPFEFEEARLGRVAGVTPQSPIYELNRYGTALRISQAAYPMGLDHDPGHATAGTVVIAAGESWPDALLAASVAGVEDAPILLAGAGYGPWGYYYGYDPYWSWYGYDPMAEIRRLDPERAIIVGGEDVVPLDAEVNLRIWLGGDDVTRLWGDDREGTARAVGEYVAAHASQPATLAVVATGSNYADVLAASALIWHEQLPLFLTSSGHGIEQATIDQMLDQGVTDVMIVGGEVAVSQGDEITLRSLWGDSVFRIGGIDRYETSALLAQWAVEERGMDWSHVALASGQRPADALTGGPLQGGTGSVLLLTRHAYISESIADVLEANAADVEEIRFLGGPAAVSKDVWVQARTIVDE